MSDSYVTVGLEISNYALSKVATGIQQVISSFHNDLELYWRSRGIDLVPTVCQKVSNNDFNDVLASACLLYTSPSPRDRTRSRMPSSA